MYKTLNGAETLGDMATVAPCALASGAANGISLFRGMFQRIVIFPVDFHWNCPMDFPWHFQMKMFLG